MHTAFFRSQSTDEKDFHNIVNIDDNLKFKAALRDHLIETGKWF